MSSIQEEVDKNFVAFKRILPQLLESKRDMFALMRDEQVVEVYNTATDALRTGQRFYQDGVFSIQKITDEPEDLGYLSHAVHSGSI
ncbi:MAG: hypothetical protein AB7O95_13140 [Geminicoccaceae bacterium]